MKLVLLPRSVGEIIDLGISIYKRHLRGFLVLAFVYAVAAAAIGLLGNIFVSYITTSVADALERSLSLGDQATAIATTISTTLLAMVVMPLFQFITIYLFGAVLAACAVATRQVLENDSFDPNSVLRLVLRKSGKIFFSVVVALVAIYVASAAGLFPAFTGIITAALWRVPKLAVVWGVVGGLMGLAVMVVVLAKVVFSPIIAVLEDRPALDSVLRSASLAVHAPDRNWKTHPITRISVLLTALSALWIAVWIFQAIPAGVLEYVYEYSKWMQSAGDYTTLFKSGVPFEYRVLLTIFSVAITSFAVPLVAVPLTLFYYDLRARAEGFDLTVRLARLSDTN